MFKNVCSKDAVGKPRCCCAGMVSMLPTVVNDLFKIEGGNVQVPEKLLHHAHASLHRANVTVVQRLPDGTYQFEATQDSGTKVCSHLFALKLLLLHTPSRAHAPHFDTDCMLCKYDSPRPKTACVPGHNHVHIERHVCRTTVRRLPFVIRCCSNMGSVSG